MKRNNMSRRSSNHRQFRPSDHSFTDGRWRVATVYDHHHNRINRNYWNAIDREWHPSTDRGWRSVRVYDRSSGASSERNNQRRDLERSNNVRTSFWENMERNRSSSETFISVEVGSISHLSEYILQEEETMILNGISSYEVEHEELNLDDSDSTLIYEELIVLQERLGRVNSGLSRETISRNLKTRTHSRSKEYENQREDLDKDEEAHDVCVVCLGEYKTNEMIGTLQCGHEYHANCIEKWLLQKNNCPVCRATTVVVDY